MNTSQKFHDYLAEIYLANYANFHKFERVWLNDPKRQILCVKPRLLWEKKNSLLTLIYILVCVEKL